MAFDIDMKDFAGDIGPAAVDQTGVDTNSYGEVEEFPVQKDLLDEAVDQATDAGKPIEEPVQEVPTKQELNFKALREEVDRIKAEKERETRELHLQIEMLKANPRGSETPEEKSFKGMSSDDIPTVGDYRKEFEALEKSYEARLQEMEFQISHPDYAEVLNKYLTPLAKEKPALVDAIKYHPNPSAYAYELAKMAQTREVQPQAEQKSTSAQRIVDNARRPGTLSQAGGQGALSKADYIASMSDAEFIRYASRNMD